MSRFVASTTVNFYLTFKVSVTSEFLPFTIGIVVTSLNNLPDVESPTTVLIEPISLRWGCLAKGTLVRMANGSQRPIQDIQVGDSVQTQTGFARIDDIYMGMEEFLYCLETASGKRLMATAAHPVQTADGPKRMDQLCGNDRILSEDGTWELLNALYSFAYKDTVYSLSIGESDSHYIVVNGLVAGDFYAQNTLEQPEAKWDLDIQTLQQEFRMLAEQLKNEDHNRSL